MGQQVRYGRRRSHGAGALIAAVILVVAALIAAGTLLPRLFTPRETARTAEEAYCAAVSSDGARRTLTPDQAQNAALIANIAVTRGLPDHAATVAIATAMQESRLTNLDYGDLDSLGLFQQRPSQGWGTAEQVSDMTYATNIFYDHLLQVPDWETIPVEDAAQEVQRSGYPELYAAWDAMARAWASGLTGERSAGVTCALEPATSSDADGLVAAIGGTLPNVNVSVVPPNGKTGTNNGAATNTASTTLTITLPDGLSADNRTRLCWQTAGWLVTHARQYGIDALHADGMDWNRKAGTWIGTETAEQTITFTLARCDLYRRCDHKSDWLEPTPSMPPEARYGYVFTRSNEPNPRRLRCYCHPGPARMRSNSRDGTGADRERRCLGRRRRARLHGTPARLADCQPRTRCV